MKKRLLAFLLLCLPAQAATYYVSKTANGPNASNSTNCSTTDSNATNKLTIAAVIGCLAPGDTSYIHTGTYTENITSGIPSGSSPAHTIISAFTAETVTWTATAGSTAALSLSSKSYVDFINIIFDGINQTGPADAGGGVVQVTNGSNHITFTGCEFKRAWSNNVLISRGGTGPDPGFITFTNCSIHGNRNTSPTNPIHGIYASRTSDSVWDRCVFYNNKYTGIQIYEGIANVCNRNTIENCIFHNNGIGAPGVTAGITMGSGADNLVYNTIVYNEPSLGIQISSGTPSNNRIYNCTVYNVGKTSHDQAIQINSGSTNSQVKNTILFNNYLDTIQNLGTGTTTATNFATDPSFVSVSTADFHLQSGSTAKTGGTALAEVTVDFDGVSRPQGATYSRGAFEVVSGDVTAPVISFIGVPAILDTSVTVTWTTNEQSDSQVEYGLTTGYGTSTTLDATLVTSHSVNLSGLTASTPYHFRVKSKDAATNLATSGDNTFTTVSTPFTATIALTYPTGGERFVVGTTYSIFWNSDDPGNLRVRYSYDNGVSYPVTVSSGVLASLGTITWSPPAPATVTALGKIEVCSVTQPGVCSVSPTPFMMSGSYIK